MGAGRCESELTVSSRVVRSAAVRTARASLSIRVRLALLATGLVLAVVVVSAGAAYREVCASAIAAASQRIEDVSRQLAGMTSASARQVREQARSVARDSAVVRFLRSPSANTRAEVLAALSTAPGSGPGRADIELWSSGRRRLVGTNDSLAPLAETEAAALAAKDSGVGATGWLTVVAGQPQYAVIARVTQGDSTLGFIVDRRRLASSPQITTLLRDMIGSKVRLLVGNARGDGWTDLRPGPTAGRRCERPARAGA
jgi:hypothetical protein